MNPYKRLRIAFSLALALCLAGVFLFARAAHVDSDSVQNVNEAVSVAHGNILLHHWVLASDNFYLTDLPVLAALRLIVGDSPHIVYIASFIVYSVMLLCSLGLVARATDVPSSRYIGLFGVLLLLGLPFATQLYPLLVPAYHGGTIAVSLAALLAAQPFLSGQRQTPLAFLPFALFTFAAVASDPMADVFFVAPFAIVLILRLWLWPVFRVGDWCLLGCLCLSCAAGTAFPSVMSHNGGFSTAHTFSTNFAASPAMLSANARGVLAATQILFTGRAALLDAIVGGRVVATSRLITMIVVVGLCARVIWRMPRCPNGGVPQFLVVSALCLAAAEVMSEAFSMATAGGADFPGPAIRYVTPIPVFLSLAAAIEAQSLLVGLRRGWLPRAAMAGAVTFAGCFAMGAVQTAARAANSPPAILSAPQNELANWLVARHLSHGVGDYWTAGMVWAVSRHSVAMDAMLVDNERLVPFLWLCDASHFDDMPPPQFVAFATLNAFGISLSNVAATYGQPTAIHFVGSYTIAQLVPDAELR